MIDSGVLKVPLIESLQNEIRQLKQELGKSQQSQPNYNQNYDSKTESEYISVKTNSKLYEEGDVIVISGNVGSVLSDTPVSIQIFFEETLVQLDQASVTKNGDYSISLIAKGPQWANDGTYLVRAAYSGNIAETNFEFKPSETGITTTDLFEVDAGSFGTFDVPYTINGGTINNMQLKRESFSLVVTIAAQRDGIITLELPRSFIDAKKSDGSDERFLVLIDGSEITFEETASTRNYRTLKFAFEKGDFKIEIIGNKIIR